MQKRRHESEEYRQSSFVMVRSSLQLNVSLMLAISNLHTLVGAGYNKSPKILTLGYDDITYNTIRQDRKLVLLLQPNVSFVSATYNLHTLVDVGYNKYHNINIRLRRYYV